MVLMMATGAMPDVVVVTEAGTAVTELRGGVRVADGAELHADPAKAMARMDALQATLGAFPAVTSLGRVITSPFRRNAEWSQYPLALRTT
jgi:hypothetical protein